MLAQKLKDYKRKYHLNHLLRGVLTALCLLIPAFLCLMALEYFSYLSSFWRAVIFYGLSGFGLIVLGMYVLMPLARLFVLSLQIPDNKMAEEIGQYFPDIKDRLLNTLQMQSLSSDNELVRASLSQRKAFFEPFSFTKAIDLRKSLYFLKYLIPFVALLF